MQKQSFTVHWGSDNKGDMLFMEVGTCFMVIYHINSYKPGDIGKQNSLRCDAAECGVPSGAILFAQRNFIEK